MSDVVRFDGGRVELSRGAFRRSSVVSLNTFQSGDSLRRALRPLWLRLVKRLGYGGNKARSARKRIEHVWGARGIELALAERSGA